jgi:thiamine biosynthesis lipoprotein
VSFPEANSSFPCFGGEANVHVGFAKSDPGPMRLVATRRPDAGRLVIEQSADGRARARRAAADVQSLLDDISERLTRFDPPSELCALNRDPREIVPVSSLMARFVQSAIWAARRSGGLVDAALLDELERSGYRASMPARPSARVSPRRACDRERVAACARVGSPWRAIRCDLHTGTVRRPPRVRMDSGGIAKGMAADMAGELLAGQPTFAVDCAGDICVGGTAGITRRVVVEDPFHGGALTELAIRTGGVATSGILRRCWASPAGEQAHHLLDPASGRPAFTGVVQVTAVARTALEAEVLAKAALLAGPQRAPSWLPHGGVVVLEDGTHALYPKREDGC